MHSMIQCYIKGVIVIHWVKWISQWMSKWISEWVVHWFNEWYIERTSELVNEWINEWMSEWLNEPMIESIKSVIISESLNKSVCERATRMSEWELHIEKKSDTLNKHRLNQWFSMLHQVSDSDTMSKWSTNKSVSKQLNEWNCTPKSMKEWTLKEQCSELINNWISDSLCYIE